MLLYLITSFCIFLIGLGGMFFSNNHVLIILISLELLLLASNYNFVVFSVFLDDIMGQEYALILLALAASESALGLAILILYFRLRGSISLDAVSLLNS